MICEDCKSATEGPHHGFRSTCRICWARMVARSPDYARVRANQWIDRPYLDLLGRFGVTHNEVKEAAAVDKLTDAVDKIECADAQTPESPQ